MNRTLLDEMDTLSELVVRRLYIYIYVNIDTCNIYIYLYIHLYIYISIYDMRMTRMLLDEMDTLSELVVRRLYIYICKYRHM